MTHFIVHQLGGHILVVGIASRAKDGDPVIIEGIRVQDADCSIADGGEVVGG